MVEKIMLSIINQTRFIVKASSLVLGDDTFTDQDIHL